MTALDRPWTGRFGLRPAITKFTEGRVVPAVRQVGG